MTHRLCTTVDKEYYLLKNLLIELRKIFEFFFIDSIFCLKYSQNKILKVNLQLIKQKFKDLSKKKLFSIFRKLSQHQQQKKRIVSRV